MKKNQKGTPNSFQQGSIFDGNSAVNSRNKGKAPAIYPHLSPAEVEKILYSIIALSLHNGIGFHSICEIFDTGMIDKIWDYPQEGIKELLNSLPVSKRLNIPQMMDTKSQISATVDKILNELRSQSVIFVPIGSEDYPKSLERLQNPPRWIFVKGNSSCLKADAVIAIVGTRNATPIGLKLASQCAGELAKRNAVVLSGLAKGIDQNAHQGAINYYGQSIAILGYGVIVKDAPHDIQIAERIIECDGAIISEYLPFDIPSRTGFLRRNELQVALSNVVIPVECPSLESGTGATIRRAMRIDTPVVGIIPENEINESMQATNANLKKLNKPVFKVRSENSKEFWKYLQETVPNHDWSINPLPGQERLFKDIARRVSKLRNPLSIDGYAVDRLTQEIKEAINKE